MTRELAEYVAVGVVSKISPGGDIFSGLMSSEFSGNYEELCKFISEKLGLIFTDATIKTAVRILAECGLVRVTDDPFAGTYYKIRRNSFSDFVAKSKKEIEEATEAGLTADEIINMKSDWPNAAAYLKYGKIDDYYELGDTWLSRVFDEMRRRASAQQPLDDLETERPSDEFQSEIDIPASDRIVDITDNRRLADNITVNIHELVLNISRDNEISEQLGDEKVRIISELNAGSELVKSGRFRVKAIMATVGTALLFLIKEFSGTAAGDLASSLFELLKPILGL